MPPIARPLSRRRFVTGAGIVATCFALPAHAQPAPGAAADGFRVLRARPGTASLRGEGQPATPLWTYEGTAPGPLLRAKRGEELRVRLINELPEPTCVHWHGVRSPNAMDGVTPLTQAPIAPGARFDYRFRPPDAGTFWYHPAGNLAAQAARGLRGALIVDETEPVAVDRDLLLFLEDWPPAPDGTMTGEPDATAHLTVNGAPALEVPVRTHERLRLRIVNAAAARALGLGFGDHAAFVVAIDGQPVEPFRAHDNRLVLGPGNRIDLFVDATLAPGNRAAIVVHDGRGEMPLVHLVYGPEPARAASLPAPTALPANPLPARLDLRTAARHQLLIDGQVGPSPVPQRSPRFSVPRGRIVVLACTNRTELVQSLHLHGHHCRLLDRLDDGWKPYWLDTVTIGARQTERIAFLADNPGKWLIEAQALGRAPSATAVWFEVT